MSFSEEEKDLFYELWFSVLAYANRQLRVVPGITQPKDVIDKPKEHLAKIRDALLEHPKLLEGFVSENPKLTPEQQAIVLGWRGWIPGEFFVIRLLKPYAVLMTTKEPAHLYGVVPLRSSFEEVLGWQPVPLWIKTLLLPFRGQVTYDGLIMVYSIHFGPGVRSSLNEGYNKLKEREGIIEQLANSLGQPQIRTSLDRQKPRKPAPDWRPAMAEIVAQTEKMRQADTKAQSAAFGLLRAAATLAQSTLTEPSAREEHVKSLRQVYNALTRLEKLLR